ncbi:MAG TPA: sugar phosphate nucleotidyltransferase [Caldisericia bacterium]|nr:sugar phosphate nucleotidyltransferase [Caldisericia bacterium]HOL83175.1 sugar phosphate nucleotidyltransferase [Caldisericia bacterium]HPP43711.1 sugar phosphate nucleotidyltransferase [Caldisericia bacterium]
MIGVILAGGFGTRLRPLTINIPKPMVPIANKPILHHIIKLLKKNGIKDLIIILYYQPELIKDYFKDGEKFGVNIKYIISDEDLGTCGATALAKDYLKDDFLVISGDVLTDFNLSEIINFHLKKKSIATITLTRVSNPLQYGIVITNEDGKIVRFLEKPSWGEVFSDTINTGIYILNPKIFDFVPEKKEFDFSKNLFPLLLKKELPIFGYISSGYWKDIGNVKEYKIAHEDIIKGQVEIEIEGERASRIGSDIWMAEDCKIKNIKNLLGTVVLGNNVKIGNSRIFNSFIGDNVEIEDGVEISDSIIWENTKIKKECKISDSILCKKVFIDEKTTLEGENIVSDECNIGKYVTLKKGVFIWPSKIVTDNSIVTHSLVWGKSWSTSLFGSYGIIGANNVEVTPEFAAKIGCAYGTILGKGSEVFTGRDVDKSSRMLKRAMIAGLISTGVNVQDLRATPVPILRFAIRTQGSSGGVHVKRSPFDPHLTNIKFFDKEGFDLSVSMEQNIERIFFREEFYRGNIEEIGTIDVPTRIVESYRNYYLDSLDLKNIKSSNLKFVVDYSFGSTVMFLPNIIGDFDLEIFSLNAYMDGRKSVRSFQEFQDALNKIAMMVKSINSDFGVLIDANGEKVFVIDNSGEIYSNTRLVSIFIKLLLLEKQNLSVTIPVNASYELINFLNENDVKFNLTSTISRNIIRDSANSDFGVDLVGGFIFENFLPFFDGIFTIGKFIELLAKSNKTLVELKKFTPKRDPSHIEINCPFEIKGKIMRKLSEVKSFDPEAIEGIKLTDSDGFVFVLPDSDRPVIHIYSSYTSLDKEIKKMNEKKEEIEKWILE